MNILLPVSFLKEKIDTKLDYKEIAEKLSLHSMSVEHMYKEAPLLSDLIVLGKILSVSPHPDADKLQLAVVTDGSEEFNVVCGAPNIKADMKIAFAKVGAKVKWHGEGDLVELKPAKIRGEMSYGMICDNSEIGLAKEVDPNGVADYSHLDAELGTPLAQALGLDDIVFDIEITTNRIDTASAVGMARELASLTGEEYKETSFVKGLESSNEKPLSITIEDSNKCYGFNGVVLKNVNVGPSPDWMQRRLKAMGHTPINNIVDITNYVMREVGHPLHAFDYDTLQDGAITIRSAKEKEVFESLDDMTYELKSGDIVVADAKSVQSLGGVKGGNDSKITEKTTTVLLEAASWNAQFLRDTMMRLDLFSDAGGYFNKHVSKQQSKEAFFRAIELLQELAGAEIASEIIHQGYSDYQAKTISVSLKRAEKIMGVELNSQTVLTQLATLGFNPVQKDELIECTVPHWRAHDMEIEEDLIEEIARLYGYHNIPDSMPSGSIPLPEVHSHLKDEYATKVLLQSLGFTEAYNYSMVSTALLELSNRHVKEAIKIFNPLDEDHVYMRTRLLPSLLDVAVKNQGIANEQALFELAQIYLPQGNDLPIETPELSALLIEEDLNHAFRSLKGSIESIFDSFGLGASLNFKKQSDHDLCSDALAVYLHDEMIGTIGVISIATAKKIGLKQTACVFELDLQKLIDKKSTAIEFTPIPKYPAINLDLSILVDPNIEWGKIEEIAKRVGKELLVSIDLFDIYETDDKKSFAFHLSYRDANKTLEMKDVESIQTDMIQALKKELGAELRTN